MKFTPVAKGTIVLASALLLAACGAGSNPAGGGEAKKASNAASSKGLSLEILEGEYITTDDLSTTSERKGYLALKVKVTNKSGSTISYSQNDFSLTDEDDDTLEPKNVYDSFDAFQNLDYGKVKDGKSKTGYLVYEVVKEDTYELTVDTLYTSDADQLESDIAIKVDASKFEDKSEHAIALAETFVNQTFLSGEVSTSGAAALSSTGDAVFADLSNEKKNDEDEEDKEKTDKSDKEDKEDKEDKDDKKKNKGDFVLANDAEEDKEAYVKSFVDSVNDWYFTYFEPTDEQVNEFVKQYIAANSKRAQVEYKVKSYLPDSAVIMVAPKVIDISSIDTEAMEEDYLKTQPDQSDYQKLNRGWQQYLFENIHTRYESAEVASPEYMPSGGYELRMVRDSDTGEWTVDTSDTTANYHYEELVEAFQGDEVN